MTSLDLEIAGTRLALRFEGAPPPRLAERYGAFLAAPARGPAAWTFDLRPGPTPALDGALTGRMTASGDRVRLDGAERDGHLDLAARRAEALLDPLLVVTDASSGPRWPRTSSAAAAASFTRRRSPSTAAPTSVPAARAPGRAPSRRSPGTCSRTSSPRWFPTATACGCTARPGGRGRPGSAPLAAVYTLAWDGEDVAPLPRASALRHLASSLVLPVDGREERADAFAAAGRIAAAVPVRAPRLHAADRRRRPAAAPQEGGVSGGLAALQALAGRRCIPLTVHLELTSRCNARCVHCFLDHPSPRAELTAAEWCAVVDGARAAGALVVSLSGGEAMVSPHFWTVAEHARRSGLAIRVFTNGLALGRVEVARLAALRPLAVEVSIFSLRPAAHDAVTRVPGSLSRAVRGLLRLRRAGVPTVVKCPILAGTGGDHAEVRRLAARLGAGVLFDPTVFPAADGGDGPTRCRGEDHEIEAYFADPATLAHDAPRTDPTPPAAAPCGMARTFVVVSPEGDVLPCPVLRRSAGNVRSATLAEVWRAPAMEALRARRFGDLPTCGTCPRSGYCDRCSAVALLEDGDLDGPSARACHVAELRERAWGLPVPPDAPVVLARRVRTG